MFNHEKKAYEKHQAMREEAWQEHDRNLVASHESAEDEVINVFQEEKEPYQYTFRDFHNKSKEYIQELNKRIPHLALTIESESDIQHRYGSPKFDRHEIFAHIPDSPALRGRLGQIYVPQGANPLPLNDESLQRLLDVPHSKIESALHEPYKKAFDALRFAESLEKSLTSSKPSEQKRTMRMKI